MLATKIFRVLLGPLLYRDSCRAITAQQADAFDKVYMSAIEQRGGPVPRIDRTDSVYDLLRYLVVTRQIAFHGSHNPDIPEIRPSSQEVRNGITARFAYGSINLLRVIQHSFHKQIVHRQSAGTLSCDAGRNPIIGSSYVLGRDVSDTYSFFSINDQLLDFELDEVTVYICPLRVFLKAPLNEDGDIAQVTNGEVNGSVKLIAAEPVRPLAKIGFRLSDLPFGYGYHRRNEPLTSILWNFRRRSAELAARASKRAGGPVRQTEAPTTPNTTN